jgi:hypothetical protein
VTLNQDFSWENGRRYQISYHFLSAAIERISHAAGLCMNVKQIQAKNVNYRQSSFGSNVVILGLDSTGVGPNNADRDEGLISHSAFFCSLGPGLAN